MIEIATLLKLAPVVVLGATGMSAAALAASTQSTPPKPSAAEPYALRGVRLGITVDEFRAIPMPEVEEQVDGQAICDDKPLPRGIYISNAENRALGVITCQWYSRQYSPVFKNTPLSDTYIDIGDGKGPPIFEFVSDGTAHRLFRISVFANSTYHAAIRSALTRGYGEPKSNTAEFKTKGGGTFDQSTLTWTNAASRITLVEPCERLERYCLTYTHDALSKVHAGLLEAKAAKAATRI